MNDWTRLGGPGILPCLVKMYFWGLTCLKIVLFDVRLGKHWLPLEIPGLDCLDPHGLDRITTDCVHPRDGLLS